MSSALQKVVNKVVGRLAIDWQGDMVGDEYKNGGVICDTTWRVIFKMVEKGDIAWDIAQSIIDDVLVFSNPTLWKFNRMDGHHYVVLERNVVAVDNYFWVCRATMAIFCLVYDSVPEEPSYLRKARRERGMRALRTVRYLKHYTGPSVLSAV